MESKKCSPVQGINSLCILVYNSTHITLRLSMWDFQRPLHAPLSRVTALQLWSYLQGPHMYSLSWPLKCVLHWQMGSVKLTAASLNLFFNFNEQSPPQPLGARVMAHNRYYLFYNAVIKTHIKPVVSLASKQRSLTCNASSCQSNLKTQ